MPDDDDGVFVIDLPLTRVEGAVTLPTGPATGIERPTIQFIDLDRGNTIPIEGVFASNRYRYEAMLLTGRYAIEGASRGTNGFVPVSPLQAIDSPSMTLDIEIPDLRNGTVRPLGCSDVVLTFIPLAGGPVVTSECESVRLPYGTYRVEFDASPDTTLRPLHQVLDEAFVVDTPSKDVGVQGTRVTTLPLTIAFTLDGAPIAAGASGCIDVEMRTNNGTPFSTTGRACAATNFEVTLEAPPRSGYILTWNGVGIASTAVEQRQQFRHGTIERLGLDVISRYVDIDLRVTGSGAPITARCPSVEFRNLDTLASVRTPVCPPSPQTVRLPAGRYSVIGVGIDGRTDFPPFKQVLADEADLQTSRTLQVDFNVDLVRVHGVISHNGVDLTAADGCVSVLFSPALLDSLDEGFPVRVCDGVLDTVLWEDTYTIFVRGLSTRLPQRSRLPARALFAEEGEVLRLDLDVVDPRETVAFRLLFNGSPPTQQATLHFENVTTPAPFVLTTLEAPLFEGTAQLLPAAQQVSLSSPEVPPLSLVVLPRVTVVPVR